MHFSCPIYSARVKGPAKYAYRRKDHHYANIISTAADGSQARRTCRPGAQPHLADLSALDRRTLRPALRRLPFQHRRRRQYLPDLHAAHRA